MKKLLMTTALCSLLSADLIETKEGMFLELFAYPNHQSKKIAQVSVDGGYVIASYTKDTKNYDQDIYLLKISENGEALWERRYGGSRDESANKIKGTSDGYVIVGYKYSSQTFSKDVYLLKVDKNGNLR